MKRCGGTLLKNSRPLMNAFSRLVQRHLDARGWSIRILASSIAPRHPAVALRKIGELLDGSHPRRGVLDAICRVLAIDPEARKEALKEDFLAWQRQLEESERSHFHAHVWVETTPNWFPSLVTVLGPDFFQKTPATSELLSASNDEEIIALAGELVANLSRSAGPHVPRKYVASYLYRRAFDLAYRFSPDGRFVEKITKPIIEPRAWARIR